MKRKGTILGCKFLLTLSFFIAFNLSGALAQNNIYSFTDNPQPQISDYTKEEKQLIENSFSSSPVGEFCKMNLSAQYQIYNNHYPDFQKYDDEKTRYKNWKLHLVKTRDIATCEPENAFETLNGYLEKNYNNDFYFCGRFSREAQTKSEIEIFDAINELVNYIEIKPSGMAFYLIMLDKFSDNFSSTTYAKKDGFSPLIKLNPDVEYFLRKSMELGKRMDIQDWDISHLLPLLSEEKIAFLNEAVQKYNFTLVLNETNACN